MGASILTFSTASAISLVTDPDLLLTHLAADADVAAAEANDATTSFRRKVPPTRGIYASVAVVTQTPAT